MILGSLIFWTRVGLKWGKSMDCHTPLGIPTVAALRMDSKF